MVNIYSFQGKAHFEAPPMALDRWNNEIRAAGSSASDDTTINIYSTIGEYGDGQGMTARIVSAVLNKADGKDVVVNINSPGGDFFEGLAINSLLSAYKGNVKVRILGMAASAASIVALAGDSVEIAPSAFFMIHNSWTIALGNRHDMQYVADMLGQFDQSMTALYATRTGMKAAQIADLMDKESWISAKDAVEQGFADSVLDESAVALVKTENSDNNAALRKVEVALATAGMPRSERRKLLKALFDDKPGAAVEEADPAMPGAGDELSKALCGLLASVTSK